MEETFVIGSGILFNFCVFIFLLRQNAYYIVFPAKYFNSKIHMTQFTVLIIFLQNSLLHGERKLYVHSTITPPPLPPQSLAPAMLLPSPWF